MLLAPTLAPAPAPTLLRVLGPCACGGGTEVTCHPAGAGRRPASVGICSPRAGAGPASGRVDPDTRAAAAALLRDDKVPRAEGRAPISQPRSPCAAAGTPGRRAA